MKSYYTGKPPINSACKYVCKRKITDISLLSQVAETLQASAPECRHGENP